MDTRRKMRWALSLFSCILLGLLAFSVPAQGDDGVSSVSVNLSVDSLTIQKDIPEPLQERLTSPSEDVVSPIPATDREIINKLRVADTTGQIVSEEVLPNQGKLVIYAFGNTEKFSEIIADEQPQLTFEFVSSPHSRVELLEQISNLLNETDQFGSALVEIGPRKDGTTIDVKLDEQLLDLTTALDSYSSLSSIPLEFSFGERAVATFRIGDYSPYSTGILMSTSGNSCSNAFWGADATAPTEQLITANHCNAANSWYVGLGTSGTFLGNGYASAYSGSDVAAVAKTNGLSISPTVYWGTESTNTVAAVGGISSGAVLGDSVCYSGSLSGTVCFNQVVETNKTVPYAGGLTYSGLVKTVQTNAVPAVGNGDSGGPVVYAGSTEVYAEGVISGMSVASTSCSGWGQELFSSRQCSSTAYYAPIYPYLVSTGSLLYIS